MDGWKDAYLPARAVVVLEVSANLDRLTSGRSDGVGQGIRYHLCRCPTRNPGKLIFACSPGNSGNDRIVRFTVGALLRDDDVDDDRRRRACVLGVWWLSSVKDLGWLVFFVDV